MVPSLLKAHDSSGLELNKAQFDANDLQTYDIVFDQNTYLKTGNLRSSLYSVVYISKDKKSLLIAKPKTHILKQSKYPNEKSAIVDNYYTSANLHMEYVARDVRMLNFICRGSDTNFISFDEDWRPLEMRNF